MNTAINVWSFILDPFRRKSAIQGEAVALHWLLRLSVLCTFVGHGAFGIITKKDWLPFFGLVGIGPDIAYKMMPLIGTMDIALGILCFLYPTRLLLIWATFWCAWTALLRPLVHMSPYEAIERAGNYGPPLVLLLATATQVKGWRSLIARLDPVPLTEKLVRRLVIVLLAVTALLMAGHGGLCAFVVKEGFVNHWAALGFGGEAGRSLVKLLGAFELTVAVLVVLYPARWLLLGIATWKLFTELLFPVSGTLIFETIERGGSVAAPLALVILTSWLNRNATAPETVAESTSPSQENALSYSGPLPQHA